MADFEPALDMLLEHEGGYVNDPADPGGATKYGISLRTLQKVGDLDGDGYLFGDLDRDGDVDADDIALLDPETAAEYYQEFFWDRYRYGLIESQAVANKLLALSVHAGPRRGHIVLQMAINYHGMVKIDGIIGPNTRAASNELPESWLVGEYRHETAAFYRGLVVKKLKLKKFEKGWLNRAYA